MNVANAIPSSARFMPIFGAIILAGVALYYGFIAVDTLGLGDVTGLASVVGKQYVKPGTSYQSEPIGGVTITKSVQKPEIYLLKLNLTNHQTFAAVDKSLYDSLNLNDQVRVSYQRRRLTGRLQVLAVSPL
jgi:hypothetical protein